MYARDAKSQALFNYFVQNYSKTEGRLSPLRFYYHTKNQNYLDLHQNDDPYLTD